MKPTTVIHRPLITEKNTFTSSEFNRYGFEVDPHATKDQIKTAIEKLYEVRVLSVATQTRRGRIKRNRFGTFVKGAHKRAIVKIHPDDKIELF
jgi:large subunit ribosomal protein L23